MATPAFEGDFSVFEFPAAPGQRVEVVDFVDDRLPARCSVAEVRGSARDKVRGFDGCRGGVGWNGDVHGVCWLRFILRRHLPAKGLALPTSRW